MLGSKSGVGILLKKKFPNIFLWHCLNHRLELAVHDAIKKTCGVNEFKQFLDSLYAVYSNSNKNSTEIEKCAKSLAVQFRKIGKIFTVRWVASSFNTVSAVFDSYQSLAQHLLVSSQDEKRSSTVRATFKGFHSHLTSYVFLKNLAVMHDVLKELSNLSLSLQKRDLSLNHAFKLIETYITRIESLKEFSGVKTQEVMEAGTQLCFKSVVLNKAKKCKEVNPAKFIDAVCANMRFRLYTTASNKCNPTVVEQRKLQFDEFFRSLSVLEDKSLFGSTPHYGEKEIEYLSVMVHLDVGDTQRSFVSYKASGGRNEEKEIKQLKTALHTISASNADCERGFSTMNDIITPDRNRLTTSNVSDLLFISQVGEHFTTWKPDRYVKSWLKSGRRAASFTKCKQCSVPQHSKYYEPVWSIFR
jgi:hypothetical protein